ncbi:outer membrane beta-barrel protein [Sulfurospirillum cavolei]|uniref:outer membrane beta-barrel protein n=1 Tax=Sulfurospirillum cavolei TaxID=366522 RepID=UPI0005A7B752|nr:OmpW family outer membrane protein [Sulfurospirillum cavolei]
MKKSLVVASLLFIGSSALVAAEMGNSWFVGGEFGGMNIDTKIKGSAVIPSESINISAEEKDTTKATYEALKIGKYFEYGRVYGSLAKQNEKDDFSSYTLGVGYDYMFKNKSDFTPFLGVNASYTKAKIDGELYDVLSLDKPKGFNYGVEAGFVYAMSKNLELEMGVRYMKSNIDESFSFSDGTNSANIKIEAENITQYYLGLNYKF